MPALDKGPVHVSPKARDQWSLEGLVLGSVLITEYSVTEHSANITEYLVTLQEGVIGCEWIGVTCSVSSQS